MTTRKARTKKPEPEPVVTSPPQIEPPPHFTSAAALSDAEWMPLFVEWLAGICDRLDAVDVGQLSAADAVAWVPPIEVAAGRIRKFASHKLRGAAAQQ